MNITELSIFTPKELKIPADITPEAWTEQHRLFMLCHTFSRKFLRESRSFAAEKWGADFVADVEIQLELELGLPEPKPEKPALNPEDKSRAIVTIEGTSQSESLWWRKMAPELERWDHDRLARVYGYYQPIMEHGARIRELLEASR
jgi:hypothetical protein